MPENKVYVQKRGEVYTVPVDVMTGQHIQVTSVSDDLPGFPQTFLSMHELKAAFPRAELVMLEPPPPAEAKPTVIPQAIKEQAAAFMKAQGLPTPPPSPTQVVAAETQEPLLSTVTQKQKAEEFLKRLKTALEYTSKKHEKKLQAQVEIIEALISEIF